MEEWFGLSTEIEVIEIGRYFLLDLLVLTCFYFHAETGSESQGLLASKATMVNTFGTPRKRFS